MARCPACGNLVQSRDGDCRQCGASLVRADGGPPENEDDTGGRNLKQDPAKSGDTLETSSVTRREALGYGGGSAMLTLGVASGLWFGLVYERITPEERVVRDYFNAINRNNYNTAQQLFHEDSPDSSWANENLRNLLRVGVSVEDTEVQERWENADREGVQEYALVVADVTIDNGAQAETFQIGIMVAENTDGEWRIWRDESSE